MSKYVSARFGMLFALLLLSISATAAPLKIVGFDDNVMDVHPTRFMSKN